MEPKPLPFKKELDGISKKTIEIHHDKLYVGYVNKANEISEKLIAIAKTGKFEGNATYSELRALKSEETFAVNGAYLHEWYFGNLGGDGNWKKAPELSKAFIDKWGVSKMAWLTFLLAPCRLAAGQFCAGIPKPANSNTTMAIFIIKAASGAVSL